MYQVVLFLRKTPSCLALERAEVIFKGTVGSAEGGALLTNASLPSMSIFPWTLRTQRPWRGHKWESQGSSNQRPGRPVGHLCGVGLVKRERGGRGRLLFTLYSPILFYFPPRSMYYFWSETEALNNIKRIICKKRIVNLWPKSIPRPVIRNKVSLEHGLVLCSQTMMALVQQWQSWERRQYGPHRKHCLTLDLTSLTINLLQVPPLPETRSSEKVNRTGVDFLLGRWPLAMSYVLFIYLTSMYLDVCAYKEYKMIA